MSHADKGHCGREYHPVLLLASYRHRVNQNKRVSACKPNLYLQLISLDQLVVHAALVVGARRGRTRRVKLHVKRLGAREQPLLHVAEARVRVLLLILKRERE